jgi:conjugative relaxase-like TrwC/TraI family protein
VGRWTGQGAAALGLDGEVDLDGLRAMWQGQMPGSGLQLRRMPAKGAVSALDLTFRPPKSVSVLFALAEGDTRAAAVSAHDGAVDDALGYLEREACIVRRGHAGAVREPGGGLVVAAFQHHSSRAGDPLLHTHAVAANMAQGLDGRWTALDGRALFGHAKTAGFLYHAALRARLSEALGVRWGPVREGTAEVQGVPRAVIEHFSRRRAEIREAMAAKGGKSARAAQLATVRTRRAKQDVDPARQRAEWLSRAAEFGFGREEIRELVGREPERRRLLRSELVRRARNWRARLV